MQTQHLQKQADAPTFKMKKPNNGLVFLTHVRTGRAVLLVQSDWSLRLRFSDTGKAPRPNENRLWRRQLQLRPLLTVGFDVNSNTTYCAHRNVAFSFLL